MDKKRDPGYRRLDGSRPTASGAGTSDIGIQDSERSGKVKDPEREEFEKNFDFRKGYMVHPADMPEYFDEMETKGEKAVQKRLTKEGYALPSGGWVYSPPQ